MHGRKQILAHLGGASVKIIQRYEGMWRHFFADYLIGLRVVFLFVLAQLEPNNEGFTF